MSFLSLFKSSPIPKWKIKASDLLSHDLADYESSDCHNDLKVVRELLASELVRNDVIVAGGFAACLAGITNDYGDIDLFCVNHRLFHALHSRFAERSDVDITQELRRSAGYCGSITYAIEFEYQDLQFHLINLPKLRNGFDIIKRMDLNWSMVYIDLTTDQITAHPEALSTKPRVNRRFIRPTTPSRMQKYANRLHRKIDQQAFETLFRDVRVDHRAS